MEYSCSLHGIRKQREREREEERVLRQDVAPMDMLPVTYFLQLDSTSELFLHCPMLPARYEHLGEVIIL